MKKNEILSLLKEAKDKGLYFNNRTLIVGDVLNFGPITKGQNLISKLSKQGNEYLVLVSKDNFETSLSSLLGWKSGITEEALAQAGAKAFSIRVLTAEKPKGSQYYHYTFTIV